tara:strand:+ start:54791 stop:55603 length:813 start_codon:yes stop_codon:yes gene_type:complete
MKSKFIYLFISVFLLFTGCASNKVSINYENSNPIKIEESTQGLEISDFLPPAIEKEISNGSIAIRSIESDLDNHLDASLRYIIEDNLIANLIDNGYKVLERDPDILSNIYRESSDKFKLPTNISATNLNAADYILSYRVLECGISYRKPNNDSYLTPGKSNWYSDALGKQVERIAMTRLHLRLTDSKTSEIITAGLLESQVKDLITEDDIKGLKKINYNFYSHTLPLSTVEDSKINPNHVIKKEKSDYKKNILKWTAVAGGTFWLLLNLY